MCFRFESCFGVHVHDDDDYYTPSLPSKGVPLPPHHRQDATPTTKTPAPTLRDGYYYTNGHHAQQGLHRGNAHTTAAYYHQYQPAHADEADRRKRPSGAPAPAPAVAAMGAQGYATGAQAKAHAYTGYTAGADEALKRPAAARNNKVAHGAGNGAQYYYEHEQPIARKEVTKDYYYPTATATSEQERY